MSEDGNNFNSRIESDLSMRVYRLAEQLQPWQARQGQYDAALGEMLMFAPVNLIVEAGGRPQVVPRDPRQLAILAISMIHRRLWDIARRHWRKSVEERGELSEIFAIQEQLDTEENHWREMLGLARVDSRL